MARYAILLKEWYQRQHHVGSALHLDVADEMLSLINRDTLLRQQVLTPTYSEYSVRMECHKRQHVLHHQHPLSQHDPKQTVPADLESPHHE